MRTIALVVVVFTIICGFLPGEVKAQENPQCNASIEVLQVGPVMTLKGVIEIAAGNDGGGVYIFSSNNRDAPIMLTHNSVNSGDRIVHYMHFYDLTEGDHAFGKVEFVFNLNGQWSQQTCSASGGYTEFYENTVYLSIFPR